jgi:hypothetical protein
MKASWSTTLPFRVGRSIPRGPYWRVVLPFGPRTGSLRWFMTPMTVRVPVTWVAAAVLLVVAAMIALITA